MYTITNVGGTLGGEAYLLVTKDATALIDSGFSSSAPKMIQNIQNILGDRPLDYVLLTHSHYDHASGSAYIHDVWKDAKIIGSAYAHKIFGKPTAIDVMRELNNNAASLVDIHNYEDKLDQLTIDQTVSEGELIDLGSLHLRVIEAPGHTRCSIAFFSEEESLLLSCETLGLRAGDRLVIPCYMIGYDIAMDSIRKLIATDAQNILIPHQGMCVGEEAEQFLKDALYWNEEVMRMVSEGFHTGKSEEEMAQEYRDLFYTPTIAALQPEKAFVLNLSYMLPMLLKEAHLPT